MNNMDKKMQQRLLTNGMVEIPLTTIAQECRKTSVLQCIHNLRQLDLNNECLPYGAILHTYSYTYRNTLD